MTTVTWVLLMAFQVGEAEIYYKRPDFPTQQACEEWSERMVQETKATVFETVCLPMDAIDKGISF